MLDTTERNSVPAQITRPISSAHNPTSNIYEQKRPPTDVCLLCNCLFDDVHIKRLCPQCEAKIHNGSPREEIPIRSNIRPQATNLYVPQYDNRYSTVLSLTPKARDPRKIFCPHCKKSQFNT